METGQELSSYGTYSLAWRMRESIEHINVQLSISETHWGKLPERSCVIA